MAPSVGRIVHFVNGFDQHEAAIITRVWTAETVNLCAFTDGGTPEPHTSAVYDDSATPARFTWHWPERVEG